MFHFSVKKKMMMRMMMMRRMMMMMMLMMMMMMMRRMRRKKTIPLQNLTLPRDFKIVLTLPLSFYKDIPGRSC